MMLQAAINGSRAPDEHLALPVTAAQIALAAQQAIAAGAEEIHLHVRDGDGRESLASGRGYDTRVGLEDMLVLPNGVVAKNNTELVTAARQLMI